MANIKIGFDQSWIRVYLEKHLQETYGVDNVKIWSDVAQMPSIRKHTTLQELKDWVQYHRYDSCSYKIQINGKMYYLYFRNGRNPSTNDFTRLSSYTVKPYDQYDDENKRVQKHIVDLQNVEDALTNKQFDVAAEETAKAILNDLATIL